MKKPAAKVKEYTAIPKFGVPLPLAYNGCKIYASVDAYGVMPAPGRSKYDRRFAFKPSNKADVWKAVVSYCGKPFIPESSPNYVKLK
jgi:hypothetical protein